MESVLINHSATRVVPDSYASLSTRLYEKIFAEWDMKPPLEDRNYFHLFELLLNDGKKKFVASVELEEKIWQMVRWFVESTPVTDEKLPRLFSLGGKLVSVPEKAGALSIGQNIVLRQLLDRGGYLNQFVGMAIAIYLQPLVDEGKFNKARAIELYENEIAERPITEIFALGFFLLVRVNNGGRKPLPVWQRVLISLTKKPRRQLPAWQDQTVWRGIAIPR